VRNLVALYFKNRYKLFTLHKYLLLLGDLMRTSFLFILTYLIGTAGSQATEGNKGERHEKVVNLKAGLPVSAEVPAQHAMTIERIMSQFEKMTRTCRAIIDDPASSQTLARARSILADYEDYKASLAKLKCAFQGTDKFMMQLHRSLAFATWIVAVKSDKEKPDEAIKLYQQCIDHARSYEIFEARFPNTPSFQSNVSYFLADSLTSHLIVGRKTPKERYDDTLEAAKRFEALNSYPNAYISYANVYELLMLDKGLGENQHTIHVIQSKLRNLLPLIGKEDSATVKLLRNLSSFDRAPRLPPDQGRNVKRNLMIMRTRYQDHAEAYLLTAKTFLEQGNNVYGVSYNYLAFLRFIDATLFAIDGEKRLEIYDKALESIKLFEKEALKLIISENLLLPSDPNTLRGIYNIYFASHLNRHNNANVLTNLRSVIYTFVYMGDFEQAKLRCDLLCQLEEEQGVLSEETRLLSIKVNVLNGDIRALNAFIEYLKVEDAQAEQKREARRKKKERQKAKQKEGAQQAAQAAVVAQSERKVETSTELPDDSVTSVETKTETADTDGFPFISVTHPVRGRVDNLKKEYADQEEKSKAKRTAKPAPAMATQKAEAVPEAQVGEEQGVQLKRWTLNSGLYGVCHDLLTGRIESKSITREQVLNLFEALGCEIDERRGKGSHAIIRVVRNKLDGSIYGCLPEFAEDEAKPLGEEEEPNITMPVPKKWDGPMHPYMYKALRKLLEDIGCTLETIERVKTEPVKQSPGPKKSNKGAKKK
jgi:hypothetical protein